MSISCEGTLWEKGMIFAGKMKDMYLGFCIFVGNLFNKK